MATIRKRGKYYHIDYYDPNGERVQKSLHVTSKSDALVLKSEIEYKLSSGHTIINKDSLIEPYLEKYLNQLETKSSSVHFKDEKRYIKQFLDWSAIVKLSQITSDIFNNYLSYRKKQGSASHSLWHFYNAVRAFLNWCVKNDILEKNPIAKISLPRRNLKPPRFLNKDEARELIEASKGSILEYMVYCMLYCGFRPNELTKTQWNHFDFDRNTVNIPLSKSGKFRTVPFNPILKDLLAPIIKPAGKCFHYKTLPPKKQWYKILKNLSFTGFDFYSLRHTYITTAILAGIPLPVVSKMAGHSSINTTMIYVHVLGIHEKEAALKINY